MLRTSLSDQAACTRLRCEALEELRALPVPGYVALRDFLREVLFMPSRP